MTETKAPFLSLCVIVKNGAETLPALLRSVENTFDEIVIVDTGSTDGTRQILSENPNVLWCDHKWLPVEKRAKEEDEAEFAEARQFAFEQASGTWRMYLDADDTLEYRGPPLGNRPDGTPKRPDLRGTIRALAQRNPEANAMSLPYLYAEGDTRQNVVRCVRWADGWKWADPVHESLLPASGKRHVVGLTDLCVVHHKTEADYAKAFERNQDIITRWLASSPNLDPVRKGKAIYHLAMDAFNRGLYDEADELFVQTARLTETTNYYGLAQNERVRCNVIANNLPRALAASQEHMLRWPNDRAGYLRAGWVYALMERWEDATLMFEDAARRQDMTAFHVADDEWLTKGLVPALWAAALIKRGTPDDMARAETLLASIPTLTRQNPVVRRTAVEAQRLFMKTTGLHRLMDYVDYLVWDTEAPKAIEVLEKYVPAAIANMPVIQQRKRALVEKMRHLDSWQAYQDAYASIPATDYHTDDALRTNVLALARAKTVVEWARNLPKEGPPVECLAIGFQDGDIEDAMMTLNDRLVFTVCDVAPQANKGLQVLAKKWGARIKHHVVKNDHYDWSAPGERFDFISMFEVIEHVPSDVDALRNLYDRLKDDGVLFVSTPIAEAWVESYLTDPKQAPSWYGHVRAHNAVSFANTFALQGLTGDLVEGFDGTFVAKLRRLPIEKLPHAKRPRVSILVPSTPTPFDADTLYQQHLGGSEEAVVHLAEAMAEFGMRVTVFAPRPKRGDESVLHHRNGVQWRPVDEFDPLSPDHEHVLFWRCPSILESDWADNKLPYKAFHWLHDASYNASIEAYARALDTFVLSRHHAQSIEKYDGFSAARSTVLSNGIVASQFPPPDEKARDPLKVVYASSPDRGLSELLDAWQAVIANVPGATLDIFYDWTLFQQREPEKYATLAEKLHALADKGVTYHGGVAQPVLHDAYRKASVWAYPHFDSDIETSCISAMKALACGCIPLTARTGALNETLGEFGVFVTRETFADRLVEALRNPWNELLRAQARQWALNNYDWNLVAKRFLDVMGE